MSGYGDEEKDDSMVATLQGPGDFPSSPVKTSYSPGKKVRRTEYQKMRDRWDKEEMERTTSAMSEWPEYISPQSDETFFSKGKDSGYSEQQELEETMKLRPKWSGLNKTEASLPRSTLDDSDLKLDSNKAKPVWLWRKQASLSRSNRELEETMKLRPKWSGLNKTEASLPRSTLDDSDLKLDPNKANTKLETDMLNDSLPFTRKKYSAARALASSPELEGKVSASQDTSVVTSSDDSDLTLDPSKTETEFDRFAHKAKKMKGTLRFTPDLVKEYGLTSYRFKGTCKGVFQCDLTGLVFTMTRDGELLYRIIQWDEGLLQSAGKIPAGPLFNIQGSEHAVSRLQFPYCETHPYLLTKYLSVAHIDGDGMSMLEPVEITNTHVVVKVPHFSAFGLVWDMVIRFLNIHKPISGQVLLFHRPTYTRQSRKLNVFLLPENVPLQEVKGQQENAEYIEAPSCCHLIQGQTYSLHCSEAYRIQPQFASFDFKYGPNYHPTFEIRLTPNIEEATVTVRDQEGRRAWEYHVELTGLTLVSISPALSTSLLVHDPVWLPFSPQESASGSAPLLTQPPANEAASLTVPAGDEGPDSRRQTLQRTQSFPGEEKKKLKSVRAKFINGVSTSVLKDLLDVLLQKTVVNSGEMEYIQAIPGRDKARELIDTVLRKGQLACKILIDALCELDPFLSEWLQLN